MAGLSVGFIGAGKMAQALSKGFVAAGRTTLIVKYNKTVSCYNVCLYCVNYMYIIAFSCDHLFKFDSVDLNDLYVSFLLSYKIIILFIILICKSSC